MLRVAIGVLAAVIVSARIVAAQDEATAFDDAVIARADTLLIAGRVFSAESLYYDAVRYEPRNPAARLALGKYLAARGALKVGAVLMEEARYFGGDPAVVARALAPVYTRLGAYGDLATLPSSPLPYAERARAEWLSEHPPTTTGPDSAWVPYRVSDSHLLGQIVLHLGADSVLATIDARITGLVLDPSWLRRRELRVFASRGARSATDAAAAALAVRLGAFTLTEVPVRFEAQPHRDVAALGFDVLAALAPTFDPRDGRVLLRRDGQVDLAGRGFHIPTIVTESGVEVVKTETIFPLGHPDVQRYLRDVQWTVDAPRGEIVVQAN